MCHIDNVLLFFLVIFRVMVPIIYCVVALVSGQESHPVESEQRGT